MLHLYGKGDFELRGQALPDDQIDLMLFNACQLLIARGEVQAAGLIATMNFAIVDATNHFNDEFNVLYTTVSLQQYEHLKEAVKQQEIKRAFEQIAQALSEISLYVRYIACSLDLSRPPESWQTDLANSVALLNSNQALFTFKNAPKLIHLGLNFRSNTEIKVFDALVGRGLLVFPLPLAVMGVQNRYKEPDFVVCYNGKCGILEIHGDKWHPPETAAQEHERRREFVKFGINIFEIFDANRCWNDPDEVVNTFLQSFK